MRQSKDEYYGDEEAVAMAFAAVINAELHEIKTAGIEVVQLDEPWMQAWPKAAAKFGLKALNRALQDIKGPTVVHVCFGYAQKVTQKASTYAFLPEFEQCAATQISIEAAQPNLDLAVLRELPSKQIVLGVLDLGSTEIESPELVAQRIEKAYPVLPPERIIPAPDCGMKYMPRDLAFGKLKALAQGAAIARGRLT